MMRSIAATRSCSEWNRRCLQRDERLDRFQLDLQPNRIAKRAIGIRERAEEVGVLVAATR